MIQFRFWRCFKIYSRIVTVHNVTYTSRKIPGHWPLIGNGQSLLLQGFRTPKTKDRFPGIFKKNKGIDPYKS